MEVGQFEKIALIESYMNCIVSNVDSLISDGTNPDIVATNSGFVFVAKTPQVLQYDADGNLTNDSHFSYSWDGENRLLKVESLASTPMASRRKVEWQYDGKGRRIRQTEYDGSGGSWVVVSDIKPNFTWFLKEIPDFSGVFETCLYYFCYSDKYSSKNAIFMEMLMIEAKISKILY